MNGGRIASLVLAATALVFILSAVLQRRRDGSWRGAARTRLTVAAVFLTVVAWLAWSLK